MDLVDVQELRIARTRADLALAPGERVFAGGTWMFSEPQPGTTGLVDLTGLGWEPFEQLPDGGLRIAATCRLVDLAAFPPRADWPATALFRQACEALLASFKVWNAATVGGNLCLALPAGAMIGLAAALDADAVIWTPDGAERRMPVAKFVTAPGVTALRPGEVLRAIEVPERALRSRVAFRRAALAPRGRSGVLVLGRADGGETVLSVTASTPRPHVLRLPADAGAEEARAAADALDDWFDDPHGSPAWRRAMTAMLAGEAGAELRGSAA